MKELLEPIRAESLKDVFVRRFEHLILSGKLAIGQKLPSERELALQLGVSRPVVHEGLVDLAVKGLITMKPRVGSVVNDYRREGSLPLLVSLVEYQEGDLDPQLWNSLLEMRKLFELENARLAAVRRRDGDIARLRRILELEVRTSPTDTDGVTEVDYDFHHQVAMASGNMVYPLLLNSFKQVYISVTRLFFSDPEVVETVFGFHHNLVDALEKKDEIRALEIMSEILEHGEEHLRTAQA